MVIFDEEGIIMGNTDYAIGNDTVGALAVNYVLSVRNYDRN